MIIGIVCTEIDRRNRSKSQQDCKTGEHKIHDKFRRTHSVVILRKQTLRNQGVSVLWFQVSRFQVAGSRFQVASFKMRVDLLGTNDKITAMKTVVQRVSRAEVIVDGKTVG